MRLVLPWGTITWLGGDLDVDDPSLQVNGSSQSLQHNSIGYHPWHTSDLATKVYPCKHNQEYKQEQEERNQNCVDYEMGSHKPMAAILFDDRII
jgi:predicted transcriptional regulator